MSTLVATFPRVECPQRGDVKVEVAQPGHSRVCGCLLYVTDMLADRISGNDPVDRLINTLISKEDCCSMTLPRVTVRNTYC